MTSRSFRPYAVTLGLLWVLPAVLVVVLHVTLPDYNASGQCSGLGFGCTLTPADLVLFLGYFAAPVLFVLGLVACVVIAFVQSRRQRRGPPERPTSSPE
ncbi:hypothetical protein [Terrabacter sp. MAHUQ-38]|uniref:hypothetical protein n=1 Tax=unclassified Terrabacter TaxID=2630222 RepID=UPI00165DD13C|nr:hypothetical protein [Terrabacter sp. MAHUQ-38]MBC9820617.1 hypothetical protein [Terrabacter sp. MAHUQ-38]